MGQKKSTVIVAEDDSDDRLLIEDALRENGFSGHIRFFEDGEKLMAHLSHGPSRESVILLDLNMPKKDGRAVLREIKADPNLRSIPVVVLSTSTAPADITYCYGVGANTYMIKPTSYEQLKINMEAFVRYWFEAAALQANPLQI